MESSIEIYTLPYVKQRASGNLLYDSELKLVLPDNLEWWSGVGGGREVQEGGDTCISKDDSFYILQKPTLNCKAIILQLKQN